MARRHLSLYLKIYSNVIGHIKTSVFIVLILSQIVLEINQHYVYAVSSSSSTAKADKFGAYIERQPESTIAPLYDEVLFECGLNLVSDRDIEWRFRPQKSRSSSSATSYADYIYLNKVCILFYFATKI